MLHFDVPDTQVAHNNHNIVSDHGVLTGLQFPREYSCMWVRIKSIVSFLVNILMQRLANGSLVRHSFPRTTNAWALTEGGIDIELRSVANNACTTVTTLLLVDTSYPCNKVISQTA